MNIELSGESIDPYEQLPRGFRNAIAGTIYEERMREAAATGLIPEGYTTHIFLHALGTPDALNDNDRQFQAWLETSTETS